LFTVRRHDVCVVGKFVNGAAMWQLCSSPDFSLSFDLSESSKPACAQSLCYAPWLTFWQQLAYSDWLN